MNLSIGVTGHRDLVAAEVPALEHEVRVFLGELIVRFPGLRLEVLSSLAEGGDQLAARVALQLGCALVAVLPMRQPEYESDFGSEASLNEFRRLLAAAERVIELPLHDDPGLVPNGTAAPDRDRQYAQAGVFISNHCQILLALWDGREVDSVGGTAQVVRYHLSAVMEGFALPDSSAHLLADNENDLACHIVCSRDRPGGEPVAGLRPMERFWITSQRGRLAAADMPVEHAVMLERLQEFGREAELESARLSGHDLLDDALPGQPPPESARYVERLYVAADRLALQYQRRVNQGLYGIHALAVLMGFVFIVYSEYATPAYVVWIFLALFFAGVALHVAGDRREWHRKYLDYRALAEALRVQFYWNLAGVVESRSVAFAYENFLQKQDVELGWIRHVMRAASLLRRRGEEADPAWVDWVVERWVGDPDAGSGQLAYYSHKEAQNSRNYRRTELLGATCLWSGIGIAFVLALGSEALTRNGQAVLLVLMGLLPLIAGVRDTISHKKAEKELIKQYRFMARIFGNARRLLNGSHDLAFRRRVLKALGEAALEEGAEWILMHRSRPLEHQGLG